MIKDSYKKLIEELKKDRYKVYPIREYRLEQPAPDRVLIGFRHDVDKLFKIAFEMSDVERIYRIRSTYYLRHTADYFDITNNMNSRQLAETLRCMQDNKHEIGLHNDLLSVYVNQRIDIKKHLSHILEWFECNGIHITGSASHGSSTARKYQFLNHFIFKECREKNQERDQDVIFENGGHVKIPKLSMKHYGLEYEAYNLRLDGQVYISDTGKANVLERIKELPLGSRAQVLVHPNKIIDGERLWVDWIGEK